MNNLKSPFPWYGGKSRVADVVWKRFGDTENYVEPFAGSLAILLCRPSAAKIETVNDINCYLANFWRAVSCDPVAVAKYADYPVNETDLHARHAWLVDQKQFIENMAADPDFYDAKIAGWWVWGLSAWIGHGWCDVNAKRIRRQKPNLSDKGGGVHRHSIQEEHGSIEKYLIKLQARLRRVRVCCGDWNRIVTPAVTYGHGVTSVFLDPPYSHKNRDTCYTNDSFTVAIDVHQYAIENGDNPLLRIAVCGYEGEFTPPPSWETFKWKACGGYSNQAKNKKNENRGLERIWFSPHCLKQPDVFS